MTNTITPFRRVGEEEEGASGDKLPPKQDNAKRRHFVACRRPIPLSFVV